MDAIDPRDFGRLEAAVESMGREIGELKSSQAGLNDKIDQVLAQLAEARGGGKVMLWLMGGGGATVGAAMYWIASHFGSVPK